MNRSARAEGRIEAMAGAKQGQPEFLAQVLAVLGAELVAAGQIGHAVVDASLDGLIEGGGGFEMVRGGGQPPAVDRFVPPVAIPFRLRQQGRPLPQTGRQGVQQLRREQRPLVLIRHAIVAEVPFAMGARRCNFPNRRRIHFLLPPHFKAKGNHSPGFWLT